MELTELKGLLDAQGAAFEAFKATHDELKRADVLTAEKLSRIEKSLDDAVEAKARLESAIKAEQAEREALELKLARSGLSGSEDEQRRALEVKEFNSLLAGHAASQRRAFAPLDADAYGAYKSALDVYARKGRDALTSDEFKTLAVGSDPDGGYFVTPDTSGRIVMKVYETSPIRQLASAQTISTDALEGIEDTGEAGAGYAGERSQGSDSTTPQVGRWRIPVHWIDTEPKATQQLLDDASVDIEAWLSGKVADKFARFETTEFVTGATNRIRGMTSYTTAADSGSGVTWGTVGYVATGSSGAFASSNPADKLHDLMGTLKAAYLPNARWLTRRSVVTLIRKFKDGMGNYLWQPSFVANMPETIMGYPVARAEDMPAVAADSLSLAFGDFQQFYQIVDRQGIRVLRDPYTSKPFVKFYTTKRVGGGIVNYEAAKFLKFGAS
jgi:HK97 family phage major capsid protein